MLAVVSLLKNEIESEIDALTSHAYVLFCAYLGARPISWRPDPLLPIPKHGFSVGPIPPNVYAFSQQYFIPNIF
jgi:hypothetical protein